MGDRRPTSLELGVQPVSPAAGGAADPPPQRGEGVTVWRETTGRVLGGLSLLRGSGSDVDATGRATARPGPDVVPVDGLAA